MINIVFPVLNEELRLEKGIDLVDKYLKEYGMLDYQITIVDNGSTDQTMEIGKRLCDKYDEVSYLRIEQKGVGVAFKTAVENNKCDIIGYADIDLSTELEAFLKMKNIFEENQKVEIVNASRYSNQSTLVGRKWYRNFVSYVLIFILKHTFRMKSTDAICGFKFFRKKTIEELLRKSSDENGWFLLIEVLLRAEHDDKKIVELPVKWIYEEHTKVKIFSVTKNYLCQIYKLKKIFKEEAKWKK